MKKFLKLLMGEYKRFFLDKGAFLIMIIGVLIYPIIYAVPYAPELVNHMPIGVIDEDNSTLSHKLIRMVNENENTDIVSRPISLDEANDEFYRDKIKGYFL